MALLRKVSVFACALLWTVYTTATQAAHPEHSVKTERWIMSQGKTQKSTARRIARAIHEQARQQHIPVSLLLGVMQVESSFHVHARSPQGAVGLMQVMPRLHCRHLKSCDLFHIPTAVKVGGNVLHECRQRGVSRRDTLKCYTGYRSSRLTRYIAKVESHIAEYQEFVPSSLSLND